MNIAAILLMAAARTTALQAGAELHGFRVDEVADLPDLPARMVRMTYAKNGAELVWLDRDDDNKTFSVAFKTVPTDDTGVAHILEHSVLCGSERFPVKEPFVELMKSSLKTFLNAMTAPDVTIYPVSSRNGRDFLNLAEVYLDAVLHPLAVKNEWTLQQEGWRYECDGEDDALRRNGVVYSEMRGTFANPNAVARRRLMGMLFPDTAYGKVSGGDPEHIPELTFEGYKAFYRRHYHPSNAYIFLDGRVDIDATLSLLDRYLADYGRGPGHPEIPMQRPVNAKRTVQYPSPDEENRTLLVDGWVFGTFADREKTYAVNVLADLLAESNESPLSKALLDASLCEDVSISIGGALQQVAIMKISNTSPEKAAACRRTVRETVERLCRDGLDRRQIAALIDRLEFREREMDAGTYPKGLMLMHSALDGWIHGENPAEAFRISPVFAALRAGVDTGYFERCLREVFLDCPHRAELDMVPSATLGEARRRKEEAELAAIKAAMSRDELVKTISDAKRLKELQATPDAPEKLAMLPRLSVADIPAEGRLPSWKTCEQDGVTVLRPEVRTDGIVYVELCFSLAGLTDEELLDVPQLASVLGELATAEHDALSLKRELAGRLGRFEVTPVSYRLGPRLVVRTSALDRRCDDILQLMQEILLRTRYDDAKAIGDIRRQSLDEMERAVKSGGRRFAQLHAVSTLSEKRRIEEMFKGIGQLRRLQSGASPDFAALAAKIFTRDRLLVSVTEGASQSFVRDLVALWPKGSGSPPPVAQSDRRDAAQSVGFEIPADISYTAMANQGSGDATLRGWQVVAAQILSLDYLWQEIRLKGGAYGGAFSMDADGGEMLCASWNDPNPAHSFAAFSRIGDALEEFVKSGNPIESHQVASVGRLEPYRSPRAEAERATYLHFSGRAPSDIQRLRSEILNTSRSQMADFAKTLKSFSDGAVRCAIGSRALLDACALDAIEPVSRQ